VFGLFEAGRYPFLFLGFLSTAGTPLAMINELRTIGVVGAGQMGNGIAHVCALAGYEVLLNDVEEARIDAGLQIIERNMARQVRRGMVSEADMQQALPRIRKAKDMRLFEGVDLAIESATEKEDVKHAIFADLQKVLRADALLASNTSSISITKLAARTDRPERFIGVHFMNPVPLMKLVELIRGLATSQETYDLSIRFIGSLGKTIANAEDFPAFIVNRVLIPMINEAVYTLYEGVGTVESIDKAMRLGANHPMGPLELADFIGLDTCLSIMQVLNEGLADTKYRPCPLLVKYVEAGWLGQKTRRGFYDYRGETPIPTR
jgi:3-hydroxybutyryl-CoA dehydrogenase